MSSINAETGLLFTDAEEQAGQSLAQSAVDRVLTFRGTRLGRPNYGSLATGFPGSQEVLADSVRQALESDPRITDINISRAGPELKVVINGQAQVAVTGQVELTLDT